jgi:hypothetical protein
VKGDSDNMLWVRRISIVAVLLRIELHHGFAIFYNARPKQSLNRSRSS